MHEKLQIVGLAAIHCSVLSLGNFPLLWQNFTDFFVIPDGFLLHKYLLCGGHALSAWGI